ncbi:MAG: hypothetical protein AB7G23_19935 [Vicinamibacterales bacterium]
MHGFRAVSPAHEAFYVSSHMVDVEVCLGAEGSTTAGVGCGIGFVGRRRTAELGREDTYGHSPAAFGVGNTTIAAGGLIGLALLGLETARPDRSRTTAAAAEPTTV